MPTDATNETAFSWIDEVLGRVSGVDLDRAAGQSQPAGLDDRAAELLDPRPGEDERTATTAGSTLDSLIKEFGFPVPRPFAIK